MCYSEMIEGKIKSGGEKKRKKPKGFLLTTSGSHQWGNDTALPPCEAVGHCMRSGWNERDDQNKCRY